MSAKYDNVLVVRIDRCVATVKDYGGRVGVVVRVWNNFVGKQESAVVRVPIFVAHLLAKMPLHGLA